MINPCATTAECLERLLSFYEERADDDCDMALVKTTRECIAEMLRPLTCEELVGMEPHCRSARQQLERAARG